MTVRIALVLMLSLACSRASTTSSSSVEDPPPTAAPPESPEAPAQDDAAEPAPPAPTPVPPAPSPVEGGTPTAAAEAYAACEARLEQPEAAGECTSSEDCAPAGCSSEKCITKVAAADLMGTCEVLPCFSVVESCTCQEGLCRWTLKE